MKKWKLWTKVVNPDDRTHQTFKLSGLEYKKSIDIWNFCMHIQTSGRLLLAEHFFFFSRSSWFCCFCTETVIPRQRSPPPGKEIPPQGIPIDLPYILHSGNDYKTAIFPYLILYASLYSSHKKRFDIRVSIKRCRSTEQQYHPDNYDIQVSISCHRPWAVTCGEEAEEFSCVRAAPEMERKRNIQKGEVGR